MINILFFAQTRERLDCGRLQYPLPNSISVEQLKKQLRQKDDIWNQTLAADLLCAVNQNLVPVHHLIKEGDEVAFFPAVTGG